MGKNPRPIKDGGERDSDPSGLDDLRVVPTQCTEAERDAFIAQGQNFTGELLTCTDSRRVYRGNSFVGPVISQGDVADEAAMIALNATNARKCRVGDWCYRTDQGGVRYDCVNGYGLTADDWRVSVSQSVAVSTGQYIPMAAGDADSPSVMFAVDGSVMLTLLTE